MKLLKNELALESTCNIYAMNRRVASSFKTRGTAECLGLDTTRIANCVNSLKKLTVNLSILTPTNI